jgi:threonine aldolase
MDRIDFRSDTVSWPTEAMREAMARATVGDDVYGEDPTVRELEALAAELTGKEAALFVASGTMGNLTAILAHANRGDEAIVARDAHTYLYEAGGMSALGGIFPRVLSTDGMGRFDVAEVETAVSDPHNAHYPRTSLILVENSYGSKHGYPLPPDYFAAIRQVADRHGLAVHMDGARLFNAAVAQNLPATALTQDVGSVTFCLSKGLCAPVGSVLCGSADFIHRAHRARKILGGGMRQAGILAAAGLVALREMVERLADDHAHARLLADGLAQIPGIVVQPEMVRTNMVFWGLDESVKVGGTAVADALRDRANVWIGPTGPRSFRTVTHYWIGRREVEALLTTLRETLAES